MCVYHGAAGESIEHVKEDEAGEGHGGVPWSDHLILHLRNMLKLTWKTSSVVVCMYGL